jgi:lipoprotein-releasing system ATP-binding protein
MTLLLEAEHLQKSFSDPTRLDVLVDISLSIQIGESIAICGRSGEGKTTLLHILGTLENADSGNLSIGGEQVTSKNASSLRRQKIGFVFQSFNLLEDFTALDNVLMPSRIARLRPDREKAIELLSDVGLGTSLHKRARLLSGGERQRVAIARALSNDPALILADEPTGNLDRENRELIGELLMREVRAKQKSLILVTHDAYLASLCDRTYLLQNGRLVVLNK